ncbi:MAG: pantoate--beta-alanine ligase [Anditalea sp.]
MKIIHTKEGIQQAVFKHRCLNETIGLVPTMGALHKGHFSLVEKSKYNSAITVVSIFVNPIQFNNKSDLERYPRTLEKDLALLGKLKVDYVFIPEEKEIYPEKTLLKFDFSGLETTLEGAFRPGHFNGVGIIVSKLLHIIHPSHVYFGQKDLQQVAIINRLIKDLSFNIEVIVVPTAREDDGLAMSSRNIFLNQEERMAANILYKNLSFAKDELLNGVNWFEVKDKINEKFLEETLIRLEYFELVKSDSMEKVSTIDQNSPCSICTAAYVGNVRLIDNMTIYI